MPGGYLRGVAAKRSQSSQGYDDQSVRETFYSLNQWLIKRFFSEVSLESELCGNRQSKRESVKMICDNIREL